MDVGYHDRSLPDWAAGFNWILGQQNVVVCFTLYKNCAIKSVTRKENVR